MYYFQNLLYESWKRWFTENFVTIGREEIVKRNLVEQFPGKKDFLFLIPNNICYVV